MCFRSGSFAIMHVLCVDFARLSVRSFIHVCVSVLVCKSVFVGMRT